MMPFYPRLIGQAVRIDALKERMKDAQEARRQSADAQLSVALLEDEIARQALVIQTLLVICEKKGLFNEAEFRQALETLDLSDGVRNGKVKKAKTPLPCPQCSKKNSYKALKCIYCGTELPRRDVV